MKKMNVALIGYGRSGRNIHAKFFKSQDNQIVRVVCVVDADEGRRKMAADEFGCETLASYTELFGREDVDLVVNASYSDDHYAISKDLLKHGFNVLSEKPFGRTYYECNDLALTAKENNVLICAFHQSLYNPMFLKVKEIIASGKLGEIFQINLKYSGFARRWDWQTLQSRCAGGVYNTGPHPIGQALDFMGWPEDAQVAFSQLRKVLTSGDSDDYGKIILTAPGKPTTDIEVISADGYSSDYIFKVFGSKGTLLGGYTTYQMKYIEDFSVYPERPVQKNFIANEKGEPIYCSEKLEFTQESGEVKGSSFDSAVCMFYEMLYRSILENAPLEITPEMAAQVIGVIETAHAQNPMPVLFP